MLPISVLTSVYAKTIPSEFRDAILSITIEQTLPPDQVVLVIDGPISAELEHQIDVIVGEVPIPFTIVKIPHNVGLACALNRGIIDCHHELIARMDMDDISLPDRLSQQFGYLEKHPATQVLGGQISAWSQNMTHCLFVKKLPLTYDEIKIFSKSRCPLNHPTVMFRKTAIVQAGCYPNSPIQDYQLWVKLIKMGVKIENLDSILVKMRLEDAIKNRRGSSVLKAEVQFFMHLLSSGYITKFEYVKNILSRLMLRTLPGSIRLLLYKLLN